MAIEWCLLGDSNGLCLSAEAWAAWAQAVGAVVAIASGFAVVLLQARIARRAAAAEAAERRLQSTLTLVILCESACRRVEHFREHMKDRSAFSFERLRNASRAILEELGALVRAIDGMPLFDVSHETARLAIACRVHVSNFIEDATYPLDNFREMNNEQFAGFYKSVQYRNSLMRQVLGELERLAVRLHESAGKPPIHFGEEDT